MKKLLVLVFLGGLIAAFAVAGPVHGQGGPPPPPPAPGAPGPPCPPTGCPTATPTVTPTAVPTATPIPVFVTVKLAHSSVKVSAKQKVSVTTLPGANVHFNVTWPNKTHKTHSATANASGTTSWSFKQPSGKTTATSTTAKLVVKATANGSSVQTSKKWKIK